MTDPIPYTRPSIGPLERRYAADAAEHGWGARCYDYIRRFENGFAETLGTRFAIATSSATGALHMGLAGLGIGPGDEVVLADINWIATAAPVRHLGATPVLVDVEPGSWCIDPDAARAAITQRTRAVIATHLYGNPCAMDRLTALCAERGIALVEDAAEAIGTAWRGRAAGTIGRFGVFSFHGTKTLTTGEGGMFVTDDADLHETVLTLSNHGRARGETRQFWAERIGFKYKMSNIAAALGCAQLERAEALIARKREIFQRYAAALAHLPVALNPEPPGTRNGYWMPTAIFETPAARDAALSTLRAGGVDARVFFHPLSAQGHFARTEPPPVAASLSPRGLNLPSFHDITDAQIARVCACIEDAVAVGTVAWP